MTPRLRPNALVRRHTGAWGSRQACPAGAFRDFSDWQHLTRGGIGHVPGNGRSLRVMIKGAGDRALN